VPVAHADRLQAAANQRDKLPPAEVVKIPGVNHLLVPARTGEADEYPTLTEKRVSADVSGPIVRWLKMVFARRACGSCRHPNLMTTPWYSG